MGLLDNQSQNKMTVCIKNYRQPKGLSTKIHEAQEEATF
jgi:NAD(P)H-flavin reductase